MATRPWITPADVKGYSEFPKVQARPDTKLAFDIVRAEQHIISKTNNSFADDVAYPTIPDNVKLAAILIAEFYANKAAEDPMKPEYKSETFDDYSYTRHDSNISEMKVEDLDLEALLSEYIIDVPKVPVMMKMRKL